MRVQMALCAAAIGCAKHAPVGGGNLVMPTGSVYLRSSFDADASGYIGRFLPMGSSSVDETAAMPLTCSQHIQYRFVDGGGVQYSELFQVSTAVAARFGIPTASGHASVEHASATRVDYELTGKLVAEIDDPEAFARCCEDQPTQCTDRYVGEMLQGTGRVYRQRATAVGAGADGITTAGAGGVSVSHGAEWEQAIAFPNPVYFALKLTETPHRRVTSSCGGWVERPPTAPGGRFYVGSSRTPAKKEQAARNRALRNAWMQAYVANGGPATAMAALDVSESGEEAPAEGEAPAAQEGTAAAPLPETDPIMAWVSTMEAREWCVEATSDGRFEARVLGWLPERQPE